MSEGPEERKKENWSHTNRLNIDRSSVPVKEQISEFMSTSERKGYLPKSANA